MRAGTAPLGSRPPRSARAVLIPLLALALSACATTHASGPVTIGIAAINDFHGNLEPPKQPIAAPDGKGGTTTIAVGGAPQLAAMIGQIRARYPNHLTISAGDLIGASPLASGLFLDEPTIEAMNRIGLDYNAVGNHEFDEGVPELLRKQNGGCAQHTSRQPCRLERFRGARFSFLAANVITANGSPLFPATALHHFGHGRSRVTLGLIGMTLRGTAAITRPEVNTAVTFRDEADTANALAGQLKARGADAVALVIHEGGRTASAADPNGCDALSGDIRKILDRLDPRIDLVISGHTHWAYVCDYPAPGRERPLLLTSAGLYGEYVTEIALDLDPVAHRLVARRARNEIVRAEAAGDPAIAAYVARYVQATAAEVSRKAGWLAEPLEKAPGTSGGRLGNLIADAQLAATRGAGSQLACTNPFGIRRALPTGPDHAVTFGDLYAVQPFNSDLVTLTLTGAELKQVLEQQLDSATPEQLLACSAGFIQEIDRSRPEGQRVVSVMLEGKPLDPASSYRVTVNSFLAGGGDSFSVFRLGRDRVVGPTDIAALEDYLKPADPIRAASPEQRIIDLHP